MHHVGQALQIPQRPKTPSTTATTKASSEPAQASAQPQEARWLRRVWERMLAHYGHSWSSVHGVSPQYAQGHAKAGQLTLSGDTWARALAGVSTQQLAIGLETCIVEAREFPPPAGRFRAMCIGVPSLARVRHELRPGQTVSRFTRLVYQLLDAHRLAEVSAEKQDRMVRDAYELAHEHVMRGGELPPAPVAALAAEKANQAAWQPANFDPKSERSRALIEGLAAELHIREQEDQDDEDPRPPTGKTAAAGPDA